MIFEIPPRWPWTRESELEFAATEGLLAETHYLDLKREVPPGRSHNRELARDLCQFTIDGGTLVIGVEEHAEGPPTLEPVELTGLAERVEQVARSIPDPPVLVTFTTITSERDPAHGYLVVHVPVSGLAPHMVDGVYYGRSDKTKLRLSDAEVMRAHQARTVTEERVVAVLDAYVARDPVPASQRRQAHAFVVAVPVSPHRDMAVPLLTTPDVHTRLFDLVNRGPHHVTVEDPAAPRVSSAGGWQRRGDGVALTYRLTEQRLLEPCDLPSLREDAIEVEFTEQATVRLLHTRISDALESGPVIFAEMPVALVRRVVGIAAGLAEQTHYTGSWLLGVHLEGIADLPVFWSMERWFRRLQVPAGMHQYRATAMVSGVELTCSQGAVTTRLMGSYLRALALQNYAGMKPWTTDPG